MNLKRVLYPVAIAWTVVNLGGIALAAVTAEPMHALVHGVLAVGFGLWAQRLRQPAVRKERDPDIEVLEDEISDLRRELNETQAGLEFTERLLSQRPEPRGVDHERFAPRQPDQSTIRQNFEEESERDR